MAVPAWADRQPGKECQIAGPMGDEKAKNKAAFGCQFSDQLAHGTTRNFRDSAPVHSVRDRGVGGSNPLAPTNQNVKQAR
jgi:hypothetical protein